MRKLLLALILTTSSLQLTPKSFPLNSNNPSLVHSTNLETDSTDNLYEISLESESTLDSNNLFIILESSNQDFILSILNEGGIKSKRANVLIDVKTHSGSLAVAMSDTYFNGKLEFFRTSGKLRFRVSNPSKENLDYTIKVQVGKNMKGELGRVYTTRVDYMISDLKVDLSYDGSQYPDLNKLRFQVTSVKQKEDYALSAVLKHDYESYLLNTVFKKSVGGVLSEPKLTVCKESNCVYTMEIHLERVNTLNIESFIVGKIEKLSINHYEDYYDRVYDNNVTTTYELPYEPSMEEMDVSITVVPVTGTSGLYVNPRTLPLELPKFAWKEIGPLAKRITIKWEELVQMKAEKSSLFIAVNCDRPGEYLVKIDAHDAGFKGRLSSGIIEAGFVKDKEINNYLYFFEVFQTQQIAFDVKMNVFSGEADLYIKQCDSFADCKITADNLNDADTIRVENNHNVKEITHSFECEYKKRYAATTCEFVVGVMGHENHGTHYDISLQEQKFHRLMIPGHHMNLNLNPGEKRYLKFSYPKSDPQAKLFLAVEPIWGDFTLAMSKKEQFPLKDGSQFTEEFHTAKAGLYDAMKTIAITKDLFNDFTTQGLYFVGVESKTACAVNLKFFERGRNDITLHTLTAGNQARGEVLSVDEVVYYTVKLSLNEAKASSVSISLTPLKGDYTMFANRNGKLPTKDDYEIVSDHHQIDLNYKEYSSSENEYIIGVQLNQKRKPVDNERFQFLISFTYSDKPLLLNPGVLSTHTIKEANYFLAEVTSDMNSLLVLKSIVDGYNINLCAVFASSERIVANPSCHFNANEKAVSIYIDEKDIQNGCKESWENGKCFLQLIIKGGVDQKFTLGFTYNDNPFFLVKDLIVMGPMITRANHEINFIYHVEPDEPVALYFNSKGRSLDIFTKIVKQDEFDDKVALNFPNAASNDKDSAMSVGYITNIFYPGNVVSNYGYSPEILISIKGRKGEKGGQPFDPKHPFILQSALEGREILRTQTHVEHIYQESWKYYTFYNNGIADSLRVYVTSEMATKLEVNLSRNKKSRPPLTNKPLISKTGISSVELDITSKDLHIDSTTNKESLKGYFTIGIKSSSSCIVSVYWNNKVDLNYLELTPNEPSSMFLAEDKKLYLATYVKDSKSKSKDDRGDIFFYFKTSIRADVYILKSLDSELNAPSSSHYNWKTAIGKGGGVSMIKISPDDPDYCIECSYIGYVDSMDNGLITMLVDVEHEKIPNLLLPGFDFPNYLQPKGEKVFRILNTDQNSISFTVSMLSGFVNVYIAASPDVSSDNYTEFIALEAQLDTHKFITINPSNYKEKSSKDFYVLISNPKLDPSSFMLSIVKNLAKSPLERGVQKQVTLGAGESVDFFYKPQKENRFEVRLVVKQVLTESVIPQVLELLPSFMDVYHVNQSNGRNKLQYSAKIQEDNQLILDFDITENVEGTFAIHLYNPVSAAVVLTVELESNGYRLLNLNSPRVDFVKNKDTLIYEAYGLKDKYLFVDYRSCVGDVNIKAYQADYEQVAKDKDVEYKTIKDANSMIHYIRLEGDKAFLKIENNQTDLSVYQLNIFNEVDLDQNPYSEVAQGAGGRVAVETDNSVVNLSPVELRVSYKEGFVHRVEYTLYLSDSFKAMKYLKNCGKFQIDRAFGKYEIKEFKHVSVFETEEEIKDSDGKIRIAFNGLGNAGKYYGTVVARVQLLPKESGYLSPVRSAITYYDEFVIVTPRFALPINLLVGTLVSFGLFCCLFVLIKSYIFEGINQYDGKRVPSDISEFGDSIVGPRLISILEQEYYEEKEEKKDADTVPDLDLPAEVQEYDEEEQQGDIELTDNNDRNKPLA